MVNDCAELRITWAPAKFIAGPLGTGNQLGWISFTAPRHVGEKATTRSEEHTSEL